MDFDMATIYAENSLRTDSPQMREICSSAARNNIAVALGFSENHCNSLYAAQALIDTDGKIAMTRRKLTPTHMERTLFGAGASNSLKDVVEVNGVGKVGQLACWEHTQPLMKYHMCLQNEDIHVSAWPPLNRHRDGVGLWSMSREGCRNLSQTFAIESQTFVLHTTAIISKAGIDRMQTANSGFGVPGGGSSAVFGPDGRQLSEDIPETMEGILYVDLDFSEISMAKGFIDVCSNYSRSDMPWLGMDFREKLAIKRNVKIRPEPCEKPQVFSWMNSI
jgi:nitrilase